MALKPRRTCTCGLGKKNILICSQKNDYTICDILWGRLKVHFVFEFHSRFTGEFLKPNFFLLL